ncbi:lymphokine-activated killer T-cell-originated protein kinase-like [Ptychodera flava]|uniref:lymphokine-activated killer T-cell-originated protein kinase-like n=1 Tax=Ptychodera flava TaxID=63121 RepID=UPI00396A3102
MIDVGMAEPQQFSTPVHLPTKTRLLSNAEASFRSPASSITIPASPLMKTLGVGTGVTVYLYERSPMEGGVTRSPWAIKKVKARTLSLGKNMQRRLKKEADILKTLTHPNIVGYRGFTKSSDGKMCLTMESGEKSLQDLIDERQDNDRGPFPAKQIYKVAESLASALDYLHSEKKILHGDLKSGNVIISKDFESVKLCDFGVALELKDDLSGLKRQGDFYIGSEPWKCSEAVHGGEITDKADIYAYGLVIWEMLTLSVPHTDLLDYSGESFDESFAEEMYNAALGTRPPIPNEDELLTNRVYHQLIELFYVCTNEKPEQRPSAAAVIQALKAVEF